MSGLTIGEIATALTLVAGIITAGGVIYKFVSRGIKRTLENALDGTNQKLDKLSSDIEEAGLNDCKNFIVNALGTIERGGELTETEKERFEENYSRYKDHYHKNGYIKARVEELRRAGEL